MNPALGRLSQEVHEFKAVLATYQDPVSRTEIQT